MLYTHIHAMLLYRLYVMFINQESIVLQLYTAVMCNKYNNNTYIE